MCDIMKQQELIKKQPSQYLKTKLFRGCRFESLLKKLVEVKLVFWERSILTENKFLDKLKKNLSWRHKKYLESPIYCEKSKKTLEEI